MGLAVGVHFVCICQGGSQQVAKLPITKEARYKVDGQLTAKSVLVGTKNSRSEGFLLAKHKHTNIPTTMEPFPPPAPWF